MLQVEQLLFHYQSEPSFQLDIPRWECQIGESIAIVGRSGCGKTTFLKCLAGLLQPTSGNVYWKSDRVRGADERLVPGNDRIKLVRQDFGQDPHLKVVENLRKYILQHDDEERSGRIQRWLSELMIEDLHSRKTIQLSGGQVQRVALAQTLLAEPEVLLLDEPFSNLDPVNKQEFIPSLRRLFENENTTLISVLHDPLDALRMADRIVVFDGGRIIEEGSPNQLLHQPKYLETVRLFGTVNIMEIEEYIKYFSAEMPHSLVEGKVWFRPHEITLSDLRFDVKVERNIYMPQGEWVEIEIGQRSFILSK